LGIESRSRRHHVLVVDQDPEVRKVLSQYLQARGHTAHEAGCADSARHQLSSRKVDALIVDTLTPGARGLDLVQELRACETWRHVPIVVTSHSCGGDAVIHAIGLGANDYVGKPFEADVLVARLESHLRYHDILLRMRKQNELLGRLAVLDELTQLYNRRALLEALALELEHVARRDRPCALLFLDLDHFKNVNDSYGHLAGDEVLQQVARRLENGVREPDVVGRYGGEEFCVVIPDVEIDYALAAGERLRRTFAAKPFKIRNHGQISVTASVGVAWLPGGFPTSPKDMIQCADAALYQAKRLGRNRVFVNAIQQQTDGEGSPSSHKVCTPVDN